LGLSIKHTQRSNHTSGFMVGLFAVTSVTASIPKLDSTLKQVINLQMQFKFIYLMFKPSKPNPAAQAKPR